MRNHRRGVERIAVESRVPDARPPSIVIVLERDNYGQHTSLHGRAQVIYTFRRDISVLAGDGSVDSGDAATPIPSPSGFGV